MRPSVSLVVPGRDAARTLRRCLDAVVPLLTAGELSEILFVDDGSSDGSAELAAAYPVRVLASGGGGPGRARNVGWRAATGKLVWFLDADCVASGEALRRLLSAFDDPRVAAAGGGYENVFPKRLLPTLIDEEIRQRHAAAAPEVDYLGSYHLIVRRRVLEAEGGFDEEYLNGPGLPGAEDADLSYRLAARGWRLRLDPESRVAHHHPTRLAAYLRAQRLHGFWGVRLYRRHPRRGPSNSYSGWLDHLQPPLALGAVALLPLALAARAARRPLGLVLTGLVAAQIPMTLAIVRRTGEPRHLAFLPLGVARAVARAAGMARALVGLAVPGVRPPRRSR
ncbi:MAG TPA: glycosyltransferase [Thermoanaerobaculia bacterium]|nr:glycosyltransferase [Thermoanaerobaculia bacterium]